MSNKILSIIITAVIVLSLLSCLVSKTMVGIILGILGLICLGGATFTIYLFVNQFVEDFRKK